MDWKNILKEHCGCKNCLKQQFEKTNSKPDYLDFDKDGDKKEPMTEALDSTKKAKVKCPKCKGKGCKHCKGTGYHKVRPKNPFTRND